MKILRERIMNNWQPIETAPKDGTDIVLALWEFGKPNTKRTFAIGGFDESRDCWSQSIGSGFVDELYQPTHWMPLPDPPEDKR